MLEVTLICSDEDCAEVAEVEVADLDSLDGFSCDCGYGLVLLSVRSIELI
jgi:hypothetical protein